MSTPLPVEQPTGTKPPKKTKWYWNVLYAVLMLWVLGGVHALLLQDIPLLLFFLGIMFAMFYPIEAWLRPHLPPKGWQRLIAALAAGAWGMFVMEAALAVLVFVIPPFVISPQTTYLTEPRSTEFYGIDYQSVIEKQLDPGVPPEDNGFRLLTETFGRPFFGDKIKDEHWTRLCRYLELPAEIEPKLTFDELTLTPEEREIVGKLLWYNPLPLPEEAVPIVQRWLDENNAALDLFVTVSQKPVLYVPPILDGSDSTISTNEGIYRKITNSLQIRAKYRLTIGETNKAWDDVLVIYRLAEQHRRAVWNSLSFLYNVGFVGSANLSAESVLLHSGWTSDEICRKAEEIMPFQRTFHEDEFKFFIRNERLIILDQWQGLTNGRYHFTQDAGQGYWDRLQLRAMIRCMRPGIIMVTTNQRFDELEQHFFNDAQVLESIRNKRFPDQWYAYQMVAWYGVYGTMSRIFCDIYDPFIFSYWAEGLGCVSPRLQITTSLTRLAFALEAYRQDHEGSYPDTLVDLKGRYIDEIPLDPFSGESFRYAAEPSGEGKPGFLLYSVGQNGIDEEGRDRSDTPKGDDIRRRVPF